MVEVRRPQSPPSRQEEPMLRIICNRRGITLIEVLITMFMTTVGILALLSMQPTAWNAAGRSDFMGRAAGILQSELERNELQIMNPNNAVSTGVLPNRNVYASSQSTQQSGDVTYTVATTIIPLAGAT